MIAQIRPSQLSAWFESVSATGRPQVLDVREPEELRVASVAGDAFDVLAIPMSEITQRLAELNPDLPMACLCHHGMRSQRVASFLQSQGFSQVVNIAGGINAWSSELDGSVPRY